ncbi:MAG: dipicolinate synthase subunit DpsA [Lachnospiraceae bacterium]|jgi:dipicolinate synthase subunit A|nr:dipicolinate synthase subunit DpsA [Lachnospiraceae bacterium]
MSKYQTIGFLVCDLRQLYMAKYLANKGFYINIICSESISRQKEYKDTILELLNKNDRTNIRVTYDIDEIIYTSNIIVTPVPFDKISEFITIPKFVSKISKKNDLSMFLLYAGLINEESRNLLDNNHIKYIDYTKSEKLAIFNSISTAEGIIAEAIISKNTNLHHSKVLVLGYGKCGKTLAWKLKNLDAKVTVCARKEEDLEAAYSMGLNTLYLHNLIMEIGKYDYIFNTIPILILNEEIIKKINPDAIILDIASNPGGVDKNAASQYGIIVKHVLGIPGKYAPKSSGEEMAKELINIMNKRKQGLHN